MAEIDVTSKIERLEVLEERLGVTVDNLSAFFWDRGANGGYITIRGELQTRNGMELQENVQLLVAVYDPSGRVIATSSCAYSAKEFFGFETFDLTVSLPLNQVSKVRLYPKKG